jgi:hypothetical protein
MSRSASSSTLRALLGKIAENKDGGACIDEARHLGVPEADETDADHRAGQREEEEPYPFIGPPKKKSEFRTNPNMKSRGEILGSRAAAQTAAFRKTVFLFGIDEREAKLGMQTQDLPPQPVAERRIEVRQRLVHEQESRLEGESSCQRNALLLSAGKFARPHLQIIAETDKIGDVVDAPSAFSRCHSLRAKSDPMFSATLMWGQSARS